MSGPSPTLVRRPTAGASAAVRGEIRRRDPGRSGSERIAQEAPSHAVRVDLDRPPSAPVAAGSTRALIALLPLSTVATGVVLVLPALLVGFVLQPQGLFAEAGCTLLAAAFSIGLANLEALAWQRATRPGSFVFADLMLWGLARRWWVERRLSRVCKSYERTAGSEPAARIELLEGLSRLLEARNTFTHRHCRRVARHAERIARSLRLTPAEVARIRSAALVHDVGKIYTPLAILHKPGPLSDEEYEVIRRHAADGAGMLATVRDPQLARIVRHHHERVDGSGYPEGLAGELIPIGARIIAVADTFDAITSERPYRRARSHREALAVLAAESGKQLDARAVEAFRSSYSSRRSVASVAVLTALLDRAGGALVPIGFGGSAAQLLPALAAAGVLAVTPGSRYERPAQREASTLALSAPFTAGHSSSSVLAGSSPAAAPNGQATPGRSPVAGIRRPAASRKGVFRAGILQAPAAPGRQATAETPLLGGTGSPPSAGSVEVKVPRLPNPVPSEPPKTPPTGTPSETPPIATPPVATPPVTTPPVKLPPVHLPPIATPPVEVPSVTVPAVEVPSVKLPGPVKLPALKLP